jgi:selenocysteine-specific elongation factor
VRIHLPHRLPLVPGDRFVLRESGRSETVGGGEVLDVAPVLPASKARPDRSVARMVHERHVVDVTELAALTGEHIEPTIGRWVIDPDHLARMIAGLHARIDSAGAAGLETATLDESERTVLATFDDVQVEGGTARRAELIDPYADHPFAAALLAGGMAPPDPDGVSRNDLRELARRRLAVERDGIWFHPSTIDAAATIAAGLLDEAPDGFTMSRFREALGTSRKYALPLLNELDSRGVTRRRGDVRIGGPRLPPARRDPSAT